MKKNISDPPATEKSAASKKNEEAPVAADTSSIQRTPEIVETSEISPDVENHLRKAPENKAQVSPLIVKMVKVSDLKPHPENKRIYGAPQVNQRLLESIQAVGIRQPLVVNSDGTTLQGHSRLYAAQKLGWDEVPAILVNISDPDEQLEMLLSGNSQRDKTNEQRAREFKGYHDIETRRAKGRQATNVGTVKDKGGPKSRKKAQPVENVSEGESGKARDIAAEKVGWSGPTAQNALKIVEVIDAEVASTPDSLAAKAIRGKLETSVSAALQECKKLKLLNAPDTPKKIREINGVQIVGFAKSQRAFAAAEYDPFTKDHQINGDALASLRLKKPSKTGDDIVRETILTLPSSTDPLSPLYSDSVVHACVAGMREATHWSFLLETRHFGRASQFTWPENAWVGLTVSSQNDIDEAEAAAGSIHAKIRWIHCVLDSESLVFKGLDAFDWIVVSVQNEKLHWVDVEPILKAARKAKCSVFFDPSVKCLPQEFPKVHKAK